MVPGGLPLPLRVPTVMDSQQGAAPPWTQPRCVQAGLRRHLSPDLRSQFFLFLPSLTACSRGWDYPESAWTVWLQPGLISLFSHSPPEMEFISHLWSVHKLLQSTYCVPGIGATQEKYPHDLGKPIDICMFCLFCFFSPKPRISESCAL